MNASAILVFVTAALAALLGAGVLIRGRRSATNYFFFGGMACLAAKSLFDGLSIQAGTVFEVVRWQSYSLLARSFGPALWLCFSLSFSRGNYREFLSRWRWVLFAAFLLPLLITAGFQEDLFNLNVEGSIQVSESGVVMALKLGPAGSLLNLVFLVAVVLILTNLEKTFRTAVGTMRWRIKFVVLGLCVIFGAKIYTASQALLYSQIHMSLATVEAGALLMGCALMTVSYVRSGLIEIDVYPSHAFLYSSITVVISGVYLLVVGLFARLVVAAGGDAAFPIKAFFVLVAIVGLSVLLLSNRLRQKTQLFVSRHFARPLYDYRKVWTLFTEKTASATNPNSLCAATAKLISDTFNVLSITIWLVDENQRALVFGASTSLESEQLPSNLPPSPESGPGHTTPPPSSAPVQDPRVLGTPEKSSSPEDAVPTGTAPAALAADSFPLDSFLSAVRQRPYPSDLDKATEDWAESLRQLNPGTFRKGGNRVSVPIVANDQVLGIMILADRVSGIPFSLEELDLLRCIGGHVAASLLGLQLSEKLLHAKEQEAFRAVSTFFAHDLKNAASSLSLVLQNLPKHFDDPEFRADVLRGLGRTVNHMNHLITRLSVFREKPEIKPVACDLNEVVGSALSRWEDIPGIGLSKDFEAMPKAMLDREQIQNVITNLLLNAREALGSQGEIRIQTARHNGWAVLTVSDNGCGMAPEFLRHSLFRPFKTTKKDGTGIGMFQCKTIVEAHRGRIEVESEPGKGTSFRVLLPLQVS